MLLAASATLAAALAGAPAASAATCDTVAARTGADTNAGTLASPYKTAQKAVNALAAGQTACLRSGVYHEQNGGQSVVRFGRGGVTLRSYPGERATLKGVVYVPSGSDRVTISDLDIDGRQAVPTTPAQFGVLIMGNDTVVERNDITNASAATCMMLGASGWGRALRTIVRLNRFHDCGSPANGNLDHAIYFAEASEAQVVDNVFTGTSAYAIHLYPDADRNYIARNVIDGNAMGVIFAGESGKSSDGNVVERNLITNSHKRYNVEHYWGDVQGTGNVLQRNCLHNGKLGNLSKAVGWTPLENVAVDPMYVDRAAGDLRLRAGSPCLSVVGQDTAALVEAAISGVAPAPAPEPAPAPVVTEPAPVVTEPAPVVTEPAPVVTEPVVAEPAPAPTTEVVAAPAPATEPVSAPAPTAEPAPTARPKKPKRATSSRKAAKRRAVAKRRTAARSRARAAARKRSARRAAGRR